MQLQVTPTYMLAIPAQSFRMTGKGYYVFEGTINVFVFLVYLTLFVVAIGLLWLVVTDA